MKQKLNPIGTSRKSNGIVGNIEKHLPKLTCKWKFKLKCQLRIS